MGRGGNWEGETGMEKRGGVEVLARAGSGEGEMGKVKLGGGSREGVWGNGKGEMGRGQQEGGDGEGGKGEGRRRGMRRGVFTDGYDEMPGWNEVTEFFDFVYPCNAGYPS